jgi:hypothetical protein
MKLASLVAAIVISITPLALAGCSDSQPDKQPDKLINHAAVRKEAPVVAAAPAPVAPPPTPAPVETSNATLPADFPSECVSYAAMMDKLKACDKLGGARDGLMAGFQSLRSAWSQVPVEQRGAIGSQCRVQADSLRNAVAATCGW